MNFIQVERRRVTNSCEPFHFSIIPVILSLDFYSIILKDIFKRTTILMLKQRSCMLFMIVWYFQLRMAVLVIDIHLYLPSSFLLITGSTMFDGIQRLVRFLKKSFEIEQRSNHREEEQFRRAVIFSIG